MVYADANILVRYIINDDEIMAEKAEQAINSCILASYAVSNGKEVLSFDKKLNNFILKKSKMQ